MTTALSEDTKGVFIISATPFLDDGTVDFESTDRLVDFYLETRVHGVTLLGMMGEAPKLTHDESLQLVRRVIERVSARVPVVVGVSNPGLANLAGFAKQVMDLGAAGVMVAPVPDLLTDEQIYDYFSRLCEQLGADIPVCYQDYPQATNSNMSVATFNRLVDDFAQLVVLKHEDCPGLRKLSRIREQAERDGRRRVSILVGNGGLYLPQELARGADGAMTGFAFPEMLVGVYERFAAGHAEGAEDLYDAYLPLVRYEQQPGFGLAVRKEILRRRGIIRSAVTRAPGPRLDQNDHRELDHLLARLQRKLRG
ncbi:MAG: dihydrodipicolinate synthase family protein [Acidiferrobacterales bacterium]